MSDTVMISEEKVKEILKESYKEIDKYYKKETRTKDMAADNMIEIVMEVVDRK